VGAGNIHLPYVLAGLSFGDRKKSFFNISAEGYSSKGKLPYQENSLLAASISGTIKSADNLEWDGALGFRADGYYLYGFQPDTLKFVKSQLQQQFFTFDGRLGLRNTVPSSYGLTYNPNIKIAAFGLNNSPRSSEADMVFNVPVEKILNEHFAIDLAFTADITNYSYRGASAINNNLFFVSPAVVYHSDNIALHLEMTPSWDQSDFHLFPISGLNIPQMISGLRFSHPWMDTFMTRGVLRDLPESTPGFGNPPHCSLLRCQWSFLEDLKVHYPIIFLTSQKAGFS
jgi:hypothetical protein